MTTTMHDFVSDNHFRQYGHNLLEVAGLTFSAASNLCLSSGICFRVFLSSCQPGRRSCAISDNQLQLLTITMGF